MARTSPVHYIAPSVISITPNANNLASDLAVYVAKGAKIKVYSQGIKALDMEDTTFQEWTLNGRNRRLNDSEVPYTVYARLSKSDKMNGYLVFAKKVQVDGAWKDKYPYVTWTGLAKDTAGESTGDYWYIKLGDVSLPENGKRTVNIDTGILGTEQFNTEWNLDPDDMPLRIEVECTIGDEDAGPTPYVFFGKSLDLTAKLVEGWVDADVERFDHWTIERNTGNAAADAQWAQKTKVAEFGQTGSITLDHLRNVNDDFNSAVSTIFIIRAWGHADDEGSSSSSSSGDITVLCETSVTIMSETVEKYQLVKSADIVTYDPPTDTYSPEDGIKINIRATDQRSNVFKLTKEQLDNAGLTVWYSQGDTESWTQLTFNNAPSAVAEAVIPISVFYSQQGLSLRLLSRTNTELDLVTISFLRNGEDSKEREWIYLRSETPITFGTQEHPLPSTIEYGEVAPTGAARHITNESNQDEWVPEGWWDEMHGTDEQYHYEYAAYRDYIKESDSSSSDSDEENTGGHWGDFSTPVIWSYYAEDAVTYRCRWTMAGTEIWQLVGAYTGGFHGTLPLVATLMKRKGSGAEETVTGSCIITMNCEGVAYSKTVNADNPTFIISESENPEFITHLNDVALTGLSIRFAIDGENHDFSIPMIREADEDSVKETIEEYGSDLFLRKDLPNEQQNVQGPVVFEKNVGVAGSMCVTGNETVGGNETVEGNLTVNGAARLKNDIVFGVDDNPGASHNKVLRSTLYNAGFKGWYIDEFGNLEVESLKVRSVLEVEELRINRLQAQEGDTIYTDNDQIEAMEAVYDSTLGETTYILTFKEKWEGYFTAQMYGNILKGIINTLAANYVSRQQGHGNVVDPDSPEWDEQEEDDAVSADGGNKYFTSWMYVIADRNTDQNLGLNQVRVALFPEEAGGEKVIPQTKNFPPCINMVVGRWGCLNYATEDPAELASIKKRQSFFYVSSSEGRFMKLNSVSSPILVEGNFGTVLGNIPDFIRNWGSWQRLVREHPHLEDRDYLYAQGLIYEDLVHVDITGAPVPVTVYCGDWVDGSQIATPTVGNGIYYNTKWNDVNKQFEIHTVRHNNGTWICLISQPSLDNGVMVYHEPKWNSTLWKLIDGNGNYTIEFVSSNGYSFRRGYVSTTITPHLFYGNVDITNDVDYEYFNWTRASESGGSSATDPTWNAQHTGLVTGGKTLTLTNQDMPSNWSSADKCIFTLTITINDGQNQIIVDNQIIA